MARKGWGVRCALCALTLEKLSLCIQGLKQNWQELQTVFQGLPMLTDTIPKMKRKEALEQELRQLERDIAIVERNPIIFVDEGAGDACSESAAAGMEK